MSSWMGEMPDENVGLGPSVTADGNQNHESVWAGFFTLGKKQGSHISCLLCLWSYFFHTGGAGEEGMWAVLDRISGTTLPSWGNLWKKPQGLSSEMTFTLERSIQWGGWGAAPSLRRVPPPEASLELWIKVGARCRRWLVGRPGCEQLPGSWGTGSGGVGSWYSPCVGGTRGNH